MRLGVASSELDEDGDIWRCCGQPRPRLLPLSQSGHAVKHRLERTLGARPVRCVEPELYF